MPFRVNARINNRTGHGCNEAPNSIKTNSINTNSINTNTMPNDASHTKPLRRMQARCPNRTWRTIAWVRSTTAYFESMESAKYDPHKEWRATSEHLYDMLDTVALEWPSLTAQWSFSQDAASNAPLQAMIGTYTLRQEPEYVREVAIDTDRFAHPEHMLRQWEVPGSEDVKASPEHESLSVTRLAQCPSSPELFAALSDTGSIYLYQKSVTPSAAATLKEHTVSGFGLAWQPNKPESGRPKLVSGTDDGRIILWEVDPANCGQTAKIAEYNADTIVNEITWDHENRIVVALETGHVLILNPDKLAVELDTKYHDCGVNCASLSPFSQNLLATGADDGSFRIWDTRRDYDNMIYENFAHTGKLTNVRWSPHIDGVLATAAMDCVVYIWDIRKIGASQGGAFADEGPMEMIIKHLGHLKGEQITALDWHPKQPMLLLSCDEKATLMAWQPVASLYKKPKIPRVPDHLV